MSTTKKRINLTVPDDLYERIQAYRDEHWIFSDAAACIQLISQQLNCNTNSIAGCVDPAQLQI